MWINIIKYDKWLEENFGVKRNDVYMAHIIKGKAYIYEFPLYECNNKHQASRIYIKSDEYIEVRNPKRRYSQRKDLADFKKQNIKP